MVANIQGGDIHDGVVTKRLLALAQESAAKILLVDDDEITLELTADLLQRAGFVVRKAANGAEALIILDKEWFPVILTDWQMPFISGLELTRRLRAKGITDSYVIMLTALDSGMDYERAYEAGVDDYLTKRLPDIELFARIHAGFTTLNLRRALQQARAALLERASD
jgi:two-component system, cell cycle response regulator